MSPEDRVKELEIAVAEMQQVLDNVRQYADTMDNPRDEEDLTQRSSVADAIYGLLKGYGSSHG